MQLFDQDDDYGFELEDETSTHATVSPIQNADTGALTMCSAGMRVGVVRDIDARGFGSLRSLLAKIRRKREAKKDSNPRTPARIARTKPG